MMFVQYSHFIFDITHHIISEFRYQVQYQYQIKLEMFTMKKGVPILEETIQRQQQQLQHWSPGAFVWPREVYITLNQTNYYLKLIKFFHVKL